MKRLLVDLGYLSAGCVGLVLLPVILVLAWLWGHR